MSSRLPLPLGAGAAGRAGLFGGREDPLNAVWEDNEDAQRAGDFTDPFLGSSCVTGEQRTEI